MVEQSSATYRLTIGYRGTQYAGWQRQANALSVQEVVERAYLALLGYPVVVIAASRTDAGVHARAQAAHLVLPAPFPERGLVHGANFHLPEDVRVLKAERQPHGFHARRDAVSKLYCYRLVRCRVLNPLEAQFACRVKAEVQLNRIEEATRSLSGHHDFSAFALEGGSHTHGRRRILQAFWREQGDRLEFWIEGEGFLRGMVRTLAGTLVEVGLGRRSPQQFADLLIGRPRGEAGRTAPPQGLTLEEVRYPEVIG